MASKRNTTPKVTPQEFDPSLTSLENQRLRLLDIQTHQEHWLEKYGTAERAREVRAKRHQEIREGLSRAEADGVIERVEEADLPPELRRQTEGRLERLSIALHRRANRGAPLDQVGILFATTEAGTASYEQNFEFIPMGEGYTDGVVPAEHFTPLEGFKAEDVEVAAGLLAELRQARDQGILPNLDDTLAAISEPSQPDGPAEESLSAKA